MIKFLYRFNYGAVLKDLVIKKKGVRYVYPCFL